FAQHALTGRPQDFTLQHVAVLAREQCRQLRQPRWGVCREDTNDRLGLRTAAQSSQRIEYRTVGFLASIPLYALSVRDANGEIANRDLAREHFGQSGLSVSALSGTEH